MSLSGAVKECALRAGFDLAGVAPLAACADLEFSREWAEKGYGGEMHYLKNPQRADPRLILPSAKSVVCVGLVYNAPLPYSTEVSCQPSVVSSQSKAVEATQADETPRTNDDGQLTWDGEPRAWISRYAWGRDYHRVTRSKLEKLRADIETLAPGVETRVYVDTGPIVERAFARLSGIGWMGKNTCLINQEKGSWFFLGVILTSLDLGPDLPAPDRCGSCTRCLDACPTGALVEPYVMDASRCIAYFNIELKGSIPVEYRPAMDMNVIGCDICQDVCPWNGASIQLSAVSGQQETPASSRRRVATTQRPEFQPMEIQLQDPHDWQVQRTTDHGLRATSAFSLFHPALEALASLREDDFHRVFADSPPKRVKYRGWLRNLCVAMGNSGDSRFIPWLEGLREHEDPVVREHAEWALQRFQMHGPLDAALIPS